MEVIVEYREIARQLLSGAGVAHYRGHSDNHGRDQGDEPDDDDHGNPCCVESFDNPAIPGVSTIKRDGKESLSERDRSMRIT
ncbi:hypothetical protein ABZW96_17260 [Nocardia sp. NPDC004168]|uniref:hypothetical protein n=1 Tax=Nocardia sp. NPDC004168 TaxID=3154452 RepID=UPI0033B15C95